MPGTCDRLESETPPKICDTPYADPGRIGVDLGRRHASRPRDPARPFGSTPVRCILYPPTMTSWPNLTHAPIVEGMIDMRVERSPTLTLETLRAACDELAEEFPSRQERRVWSGQINLSGADAAKVSTQLDEPDGIILRSVDDKWVAQFRLDGFTLSRLAPYESWDSLKTNAFRLWGKYRSVAQPARILRVTARFINHIPLPAGEPLNRTFSTTFTLPPSLPQGIAGYLLRVVIPFEQKGATAIMTQSMRPNSDACILDLDVFAEQQQGFSEEDAWKRLEVLRDVKNGAFFESLTPEAIERFQ